MTQDKTASFKDSEGISVFIPGSSYQAHTDAKIDVKAGRLRRWNQGKAGEFTMDFDPENFAREGQARWMKMTTREIAVELGTCVETLYRGHRLGKIPGFTRESLKKRHGMDPLRKIERGEFDLGSGPALFLYESRNWASWRLPDR